MTKESSIIHKNKKAYHDYEILEELQTGIILSGPEVKSCRNKKVQLKGSYVSIQNNKVWLKGAHISPYSFDAQKEKYDPNRNRELLIHKKEIIKLEQKLNTQGITIIPLNFHFKKGLIKVNIGICRGKKMHDKRADLKKKAQNLEINRALKKYQ